MARAGMCLQDWSMIMGGLEPAPRSLKPHAEECLRERIRPFSRSRRILAPGKSRYRTSPVLGLHFSDYGVYQALAALKTYAGSITLCAALIDYWRCRDVDLFRCNSS